MSKPLIDPFHLKFRGMDTDNHVIDAALLGESLKGTARTYNSILNFHFHGEVSARARQNMRCYVAAPKEGTVFYLIWVMMMHGNLAVYPELLFEFASMSVSLTFQSMVGQATGQAPLVDKALDGILQQNQLIAELAKNNNELAKLNHESHAEDKRALFNLVEKLTAQNRNALREVAAPVGKTAKQIEHFVGTDNITVIDEPIAEALRSEDPVEVGEQNEFIGRFVAVDKVTGSCKLDLLDGEKPVKAKITDPALDVPENIYTHALDTAESVTVVGKPVIKNGEMTTLYVSDAKWRKITDE